MKTPLIKISILSIYKKNGVRVSLPERMAKCAPDVYSSILAIKAELEDKSGNLYLSDLYRSYDMQLQAYLDWKTGKKSAYSPPPGGSMHEAGRAFDLDLENLKIPLSSFWDIAKKHGVYPIINKPDPKISESWHFDCRGSHGVIYEYYKNGFGTNMKSPYRAMAASAILATGEKVDMFGSNQQEAAIQAGLIRLGFRLGNIDGNIGIKTRTALDEAGIREGNLYDTLLAVENLLQQKFPEEYAISQFFDSEGDDDFEIPSHVVI